MNDFFDWSDIPIIGGVIQWTEDKARAGIAYVTDRLSSYKTAVDNLPVARDQYTRMIVIARDGGDPDVQQNVEDFGTQITDMENAVSQGGSAVDTVNHWWSSATGSAGMGVFPIIPVLVLALLGTAIVTIGIIVAKHQNLNDLAMKIKAKWTPQQIAASNLNAGAGSFGGTLKDLGLLAVVGIGLWAFGGKRRSA